MHVAVTPVFAGLLALLYLILTAYVTRARGKANVYLGDGGDEPLQRAIRAHANFNEYVPLSLIVLLFLEMRSVSSYTIMALGAALVIGRCLHAIGISTPKKLFNCRAIGIILTLLVLLISTLWLLATYL